MTGVSLQTFRAAIGTFQSNHNSKSTPNKFKLLHISLFNIVLSFYFYLLLFLKKLQCFSLTTSQFLLKFSLNIWFILELLFFIFSLWKTSSWLTVCMDIESNPGPHFADGMFSFSHMNVNSLKAHLFIRVKAIEAYICQHSCDIFAVTETALKPDIPDDKIHINGYSCIRRDLPPNTTHGGVLLYHKDNLAIKPRPDLELHPNILVSEIIISKKKIFFTVIYRRSGQSPIEFDTFIQKFDQICQLIINEKPYTMLFTGDFNAHLKQWSESDSDNSFGIELQKIFDSHGLFQIVDQPTFITSTCSTCIDLVVTDQPNIILESTIHPSLHKTCHHQINYVKINVRCPPPPPYSRLVWHYGRSNERAINHALSAFNWDVFFANCTDIEEQASGFCDIVKNVFSNFTPHDDIVVKPKEPPWMNRNLKNIYHKYRKKYSNYIKHGKTTVEKLVIDSMREDYTNQVEMAK